MRSKWMTNFFIAASGKKLLRDFEYFGILENTAIMLEGWTTKGDEGNYKEA